MTMAMTMDLKALAKLFLDGGPVMWPILGLSVIGLAILFWKALELRAGRRNARGLVVVSTIITAEPMLGILGTVTGIIKTFGVNPDEKAGTGAAGGLGAALYVYLNAEMKSGIDTVLDLINFDDIIDGADLVVTGEGRTDWQSCFGKVMQGVGDRCKAKNIPVAALCGGLGRGYDGIYDHGVDSIMTTVDGPMPLEEALDKAEELYYMGAIRMFRFIRAGMKMR